MRQELDEKLCTECPNLYNQRNLSMNQTCMCWGFDVGNGWFSIIYDLSKKLEKLICEIPKGQRADYSCAQCKEKFGSLRYYMSASTPEMDRLINEAESLSSTACEVCGEPGKLTGKSWLKTRCEKCP